MEGHIDGTAQRSRPGAGIWASWGLALAGGLAVLIAAIVALTDACAAGGPDAVGSEACAGGVPLTLVQLLTAGGTALAVLGGVTATALTLRRFGWGARR